MKCILLSTIVLALLLSGNMYAQVTIKTGYISSSRYKNEDSQETDGRETCGLWKETSIFRYRRK